MSHKLLLAGLAAGAGLMSAHYLRQRALARAPRLTGVIPLITRYIDIGVAESVLAVMERLPGDRVTVVLHTLGGCVTACVMIANALRQFPNSTAVVPYMAISGGTLIALSAKRLEMGVRASLSAVDPQIMGQRVKHLAAGDDQPAIAALAREYEISMRRYVRERLVEIVSADQVNPAMELFMGEHAPHEWPIQRPQLEALGMAVDASAASWADLVDASRRRIW